MTEEAEYVKNGEEALASPPETPKALPPRFGPGYINIETDRGISYSSCRAHHFIDADSMNAWFEANPYGYMVVQMTPDTIGGGFTCIIAKVMRDEELEELRDIQMLVNEEREKRAEARRLDKLKETEAQEAAAKERVDMEARGRQCVKEHGDTLALEAEVKKLRRKASRK